MIDTATSRELATIKLNSRKRSGKRHATSDTVGACREVVAVGDGPAEMGDSMGLDLLPIWLSWPVLIWMQGKVSKIFSY